MGIKALMATAAKGKLATLESLYLPLNPFGEAGAETLADTMASGMLPGMKHLGVPDAHEGNAKLRATGHLFSDD